MVGARSGGHFLWAAVRELPGEQERVEPGQAELPLCRFQHCKFVVGTSETQWSEELRGSDWCQRVRGAVVSVSLHPSGWRVAERLGRVPWVRSLNSTDIPVCRRGIRLCGPPRLVLRAGERSSDSLPNRDIIFCP